MKVFLDTTSRRADLHNNNYNRIYQTIKELGYKHLFTDIAEKTTSPTELNYSQKSRDYLEQMYLKRLDYLQKSDINVFEASIPSLSTGFLIDRSLDMNKPTIVFFMEGNRPVLISGVDNEKLILAEYNAHNVEEIVKKTFQKAREIRDKRFNFFISPALLDYLDKKSRELGITKSTFIRQLIIQHKKKG